ncbi:MAG: helix-turn-helix domain-containing protein [Deltaproteobacteria bacterium]|nr:helix-turn-helix domain-containing protein [Deltaproteobacteria bacterium]
MEKGIKQGTREDLQGGGLVRSAGGETAGLLGRKAEEREKGDARILGSGDFVEATLHQSEKLFERKYRPKKAIEDLIKETSEAFGVAPEVICSRSRQRKHSAARSAFAYLAVEETGHSAADVAGVLGVKRMSVHEAVVRGRTLCAERALVRQERQ